MSSMPPPPPMQPAQPPAPPAKKTNILVWIAAGCGVLVLVVLVVMIAGGIFLGRKAKEFAAGAEKNPALVVAKMIAAANPDIEVVAEDADAGTLTLRNKKTGEIITMNAEDIKDGKITFKSDKGEVTITGSGKEGEEGFKIESDEGTIEFGAGASSTLPDWLPAYPGAESRGTYSGEAKGKAAGAVQFETPDSVAEVLAFYEKELKSAGFATEVTKVDRDGSLVGGTLTAKDEAGGRTVTVVCTRLEQATQGLVNYEAPND